MWSFSLTVYLFASPLWHFWANSRFLIPLCVLMSISIKSIHGHADCKCSNLGLGSQAEINLLLLLAPGLLALVTPRTMLHLNMQLKELLGTFLRSLMCKEESWLQSSGHCRRHYTWLRAGTTSGSTAGWEITTLHCKSLHDTHHH